MTKAKIRAGALLPLLMLSGCASVAVLGTVHEDELQKLYPGEPRAEVQSHLGTPASTQALANGWSQDRHELKLRNDDAAMMSVVDVMTLGTLSMAEGLSGRPRDPVYRLAVLYDEGGKLVCARALRVSRENALFPNALGADTVVAGHCPQ